MITEIEANRMALPLKATFKRGEVFSRFRQYIYICFPIYIEFISIYFYFFIRNKRIKILNVARFEPAPLENRLNYRLLNVNKNQPKAILHFN